MNYAKTDSCSIPALTVQKRAPYLLDNRGFTLVELIAVSAILAVLASMAIPAYSAMKDKARTVRCMTEIREIEKLINSYSIDHGGAFPPSAPLANHDLSLTGIGALNDPWGHPYWYNNNTDAASAGDARLGPTGLPSDPLNGDFDLYSLGPDGDTDPDIEAATSNDDIIRAGDGGFVGTVKQFLP